jgi:integrase
MVTRKSRRKLPPGIRERVNGDGSASYDAQLKVAPFPRSFKSHETLEAAIRWRKDLEAELIEQRQAKNTRPDVATLTLAQLNAEWLKDPETKLLRSYKDRVRHLNWWSSKFGAVKVLNEFGVVQAREARDLLLARMTPAAVNRVIASERAAWNFGRQSGLIPPKNVWPPRLALTEPKARVRYLDDEELNRVLEAARAHSPVLYAAVTVALACGCRAGEQMRLEWKDIDFTRSTVTFLETKNSEPRSVHLPGVAAEALKALKAGAVVSTKFPFVNRYGKRLTTQGLDRQWRLVRTAAKLENFRWHDLRHCCASYLVQNGASLAEAGHVLGHKSAGVTFKYSHLIKGKAVTGHAALDEKLRGAT